MHPIASISLCYCAGSSDKEYHAEITRVASGHVVNFRYGRRGGTLTNGTKTPVPVDLESARQLFDRLVREKTAKGYTSASSGTPYQDSTEANRRTDFTPQLCNPVAEREALGLIYSPHWAAQEKLDGERRAVDARPDRIAGINRKGLSVPLPESIVAELQDLVHRHGGVLLDGELVGEVLYVFDLHRHGDLPLQAAPWHQRITLASHLLKGLRTVQLIPVAYSAADKRALWDRVSRASGEGIVFKRLNSPVTPGRPNSDGDWLKFKFTESASCIVLGLTVGKRSVRLGLLPDSPAGGAEPSLTPVGKVTIPPNQPIPASGEIVEVAYLYAYPGGSLFQPVYRGKREDLEPDDCRIAQLKFKPDTDGVPI